MAKRFSIIALIFALLISVIGVSNTKIYCTMMETMLTESCCEDKCLADQEMDGCCKQVTETYSLDTDLSSTNAFVTIPDITLFVVSFVATFESSWSVLEKSHSYFTYSPPRLTSDITVLIQVFRI